MPCTETYNGRRMSEILYDPINETIDICEISYQGKTFWPEKQKRVIHVWFLHFLEIHARLVNIINSLDEWGPILKSKFTVRGGYAMPRPICDYIKGRGLVLDCLARYFYVLENGFTICAMFTENIDGSHVESQTDTHYTGICLMNVELYFIETIFVRDFISFDN